MENGEEGITGRRNSVRNSKEMGRVRDGRGQHSSQEEFESDWRSGTRSRKEVILERSLGSGYQGHGMATSGLHFSVLGASEAFRESSFGLCSLKNSF